ncbi:nucleophosmin 1b isoform X3 [Paramormyrops kingsleyae]|uniref:nucleophosmin 1b isoform X3 n=1 Tax=Paramormyrops kingsleyae TaxID=1676925 RepID=UPI000CD64CC0|nr:nucleophosmin-like isoform X3 [Paramormyrops kingsleyae]
MAEDSSADVFRPQMYLFGCELKSDKKEYKIEADDDDETEHQLSLKTVGLKLLGLQVCLGAQAEDRFNMVEMEGMTFDGKMSKVQLAVLKPSVLPSLNLGGFEVTPPVTFRLKSGPGPVYISGQHFVSVKESDDEEDEDEEEEENNTSPMKRPSSSGKVPMPKKIKLDDDEDEDDDDDDDDEDDDDDDDDDDDEEDEIPQKKLKNTSVKTPNTSPKGGKENPAGGTPKTPSVSDVKNKLTTDVKEGKPLPKTEQKFENFARSCFKISDKNVIKELWTFVQTLKSGKK